MKLSTSMQYVNPLPISDYVPPVVGDDIYHIRNILEKNIFIDAVQGQVSYVLIKF